MKARFRRLVSLAAAMGGVVLGLVGVSPHATVAHAEPLSLVLNAQTFNVKPNGAIGISVEVPAAIDVSDTSGLTVVVATYVPVSSRQQVSDVARGRLPELIDQVTFLGSKVVRPGTQRIDLIVPLVTDRPTVGSLFFQHSGVYPLTVTLLRDGTNQARVTSFVHRLPDSAEGDEDPLQVAMAMTAPMAATLDDDAKVTLTDTDVTAMSHTADVVTSSAIPVTVRVPAPVISAMAAGNATATTAVKQLATAVQRHTLLSTPALPLDPSAIAAAGQQSLYTQWLRSGEDQLGTALLAPTQRSVTLVDEPLSAAGAAMLRDLGSRLFVISPTLFDNLVGSGVFDGGNATQLVEARVATDSTVEVAVADRRFQQVLGQPSPNPRLTAIVAVADLLAARQSIVDDGEQPHRHGITLAAPDLGLPNSDVLAAVTSLIADTPGLRPTTLDDLGVRVDNALSGGSRVVIDLPAKTSVSVAKRVRDMNLLRLGITATSSMLTHDDPRAAQWKQLLDALPSSALGDAQATRIISSITTALDAIRSQVEPPVGFSFNLTGKKGTVPVQIRNNADVPLAVRVRMSAAKLRFPDGDRIVTLAPNSYTEVRINMEIRSNGRFPVSLELFTPSGTTRLGAAVPLTANVGGLSGLGNLVTGAGALVVLTWWGRHVRGQRRKRAAQRRAHGHPSVGIDGDDSDPTPVTGIALDPNSVSPDAATSTLPDS